MNYTELPADQTHAEVAVVGDDERYPARVEIDRTDDGILVEVRYPGDSTNPQILTVDLRRHTPKVVTIDPTPKHES